jgi:hypothetical protein
MLDIQVFIYCYNGFFTLPASQTTAKRIAMPTILRIGGFRFHFYSNEGNEPPHIHVRCADGECKFWLEPIVLANNRGMTPTDLRKIEQLVFENKTLLQGKYYEYHNL